LLYDNLYVHRKKDILFQVKPNWVVKIPDCDDMEIYGEFKPGSQITMQNNSMGKIDKLALYVDIV